MSVSREEVDAWFAANPTATADQVAAAVQSVGGLDANAGLSDILADRYKVDTSEVNNYYNNSTAAPAGALSQGLTPTEAPTEATTAAPISALSQVTAPTEAPTVDVVRSLADQILGQGKTQYWTGEGGGSTDTNALWMADQLSKAGITDINDFGLVTTKANVAVTPVYEYDAVQGQDGEIIQRPRIVGYTDADGNPVDSSLVTTQDTYSGEGDAGTSGVAYVAPVGTQQVYGNVKTGQVLDPNYDRANVDKGIWSGTFAGKDSTHYGVQFTADGKPIFYTQQGESTSDMGTIAPLLAVASFIPGVAPFAQALNAAIAIDNGDVIGGLASMAGMGGFTDVATGLNVAKAIDTGNVGALVGTLLNNPTISDLAGTTMLTNTISLADVGNAANVAMNLADGNLPGILSSAGALTGSSDLKVAAAGATIITELGKDNPNFGVIAGAVRSIDGATSSASNNITADMVGGITNRVTDDLVAQSGGTDLGSAAYISAINAGANEEEALAAANAVTGATTRDTVSDGSNDDFVTGGAGADDTTTVGAGSVKDTEFGDLQGAINTNAMDDAVRADKLNTISSLPKFSDAYAQARDLLGAGKTFTWNGKEYSTATSAERPDLAVTAGAGAGRGSYLGYNSAEDAASKANLTVPKTNELLGYINDDQGGGYDALGNPIGGQTIGASPDLSTTTGKIANGVANAMNTFFGVVANAPVDAVRAGGNLMSNVGGILDLVSGGPTEAGNKLRGLADQVDTFTSSISDPKIKAGQQAIGNAVDQAEGIIGKGQALATAAWDNPLGAASWVFTEGFEEVPGVGIALKVGRALGAGTTASKVGVFGTTIANDMVESGGAAYNDTYKEAIKTMPEAEARIAARNSAIASMAVTGVTQGIVEGKVLNRVIGRDTAGELVEGTAQSVATQLALGQDVNLNKALTAGVIEAGVGKGASSTAAGVTATNIGADATTGTTGTTGATGATGAATGTPANTGTATDLGSIGTVAPGADVVQGTDLGSIGSVSPGADIVSGDQGVVSVADAQQSMADLGLNVSDDVAVSLATNIQNTTNNSNVSSTVTSGINSGSDASVVVGSAVTSAVNAGASVDSSVASSVSSAIAAGANASTAVTAATDAAIAAGNNVTVASDANTTTITNATTNTTTTVNNTTGVVTSVDANTGVTTTIDANTNTTTTVVTDTNTNTKTTVKVNTDTGDVIDQTQTVIPGGGLPDDPVIPGAAMQMSSAPATPATSKSSVKSPSTSGGSGAAGALAMGATGTEPYDWTPGSGTLRSKVTGESIDPLARVKEIQAEFEREAMMQNIDPRLMQILQQRMDPQQQPAQYGGALASATNDGSQSEASSNEGRYYSYGAEDSIDDILGGKERTYREGGFVEPLKASGGMVLPLLAKSGGALGHYNGREDFKGGKHVAGSGDGQSDDIPAWLADGEFVFPADVVSALGNGSTKAGTDKLYEMMHGIRDRARSKGPKDLPPPALKSALDYLKSSKRSSK